MELPEKLKAEGPNLLDEEGVVAARAYRLSTEDRDQASEFAAELARRWNGYATIRAALLACWEAWNGEPFEAMTAERAESEGQWFGDLYCQVQAALKEDAE